MFALDHDYYFLIIHFILCLLVMNEWQNILWQLLSSWHSSHLEGRKLWFFFPIGGFAFWGVYGIRDQLRLRGTFQFLPAVSPLSRFFMWGELTQQWSSRFDQEVRVRIQMKTLIAKKKWLPRDNSHTPKWRKWLRHRCNKSSVGIGWRTSALSKFSRLNTSQISILI